MAYPTDHRFCSPGFVRCVLVLFLVGSIVSLWHVGESSNAQASCPSCHCDCSSDIISIPLGEYIFQEILLLLRLLVESFTVSTLFDVMCAMF